MANARAANRVLHVHAHENFPGCQSSGIRILEGILNVLFVCTENKLRSATAETVFCEFDGIDAIGAGTNADAPTPVSGDHIEWADLILVMEQSHRKKVARRFPGLLKDKKLAVLNVPDNYNYMQPELIELLKRIVPAYLGR